MQIIVTLVMWTIYAPPQNMLPFASMEKCEQAKSIYQSAEGGDSYHKRNYGCIEGVVVQAKD
jgi:hypothetical protein